MMCAQFIPLGRAMFTALIDWFWAIGWEALVILSKATQPLVIVAVFFAIVALVVKRRLALHHAKQAVGEVRINLLLHFFDLLVVAPPLAFLLAAMGRFFDQFGLRLIDEAQWAAMPFVAVAFFAVFVGDFVGYWRHRFEH